MLLDQAKACRVMPRVDVLLPAPGTAHRDHAHPVPLVGRWRVGHVLERDIRTTAAKATATVANTGAAAETETDPEAKIGGEAPSGEATRLEHEEEHRRHHEHARAPAQAGLAYGRPQQRPPVVMPLGVVVRADTRPSRAVVTS